MSPTQEIAITSADKVFLQLRTDIVEGEICAGSKLSEADLAQRYQVSRALIREAINRLTANHLVERKANVGAKVIELSVSGLNELYQIREALEGMAARQAASNMTDEEIADIRNLLEQHAVGVEKEKSYYQEAGDVDFHYRIIKGSKNNQLIQLLINGLYHLIRMYRVQLGMNGPRVSTALTEHQHILEAIARRDGELAEMLMRRHILYSKDHVAANLMLLSSNTNKER